MEKQGTEYGINMTSDENIFDGLKFKQAEQDKNFHRIEHWRETLLNDS
jgi:ribosomal 50S subunit-associated protein YjgA (DUF615 family)